MASYVDAEGYTVFSDDLYPTMIPRIQQLSRGIQRLKAALDKAIAEAKKKMIEARGRREQWAKRYYRKPEPIRFWQGRYNKPVSWKKNTGFKQVPRNKNQQVGYKRFVQSRKK